VPATRAEADAASAAASRAEDELLAEFEELAQEKRGR
jgi:hypothetical protein